MPRRPEDDFAALVGAAEAAADAARGPALAHFRAVGLVEDNKRADGFDPVTAADRGAEAAIRAVLAERRPADAIVGEEEAPRPGRSGLTWVIDPIDGTRAYISGAPLWGVLIALHDGARPVLGLIDQPYLGERFLGRLEGAAPGATLTRGADSRALATRSRPLSEATLFTTFPEIGRDVERRGFEAVRDRARQTRYGLDCYAYALLAMGTIDLVVEAGLQPYDIQAPMAVVQAAGGVVTDWTGGPCDRGGQVVAAGSEALHREALALLAPFAG